MNAPALGSHSEGYRGKEAPPIPASARIGPASISSTPSGEATSSASQAAFRVTCEPDLPSDAAVSCPKMCRSGRCQGANLPRCFSRERHDCRGQKLRKRKSLVLASTFSRIVRSGSIRAISTAPIMVEKIAKKARSLSTVRWPGMNGNIRLL